MQKNVPKMWMHLIYEYFGIGTFQPILIKENINDTSN